VPLSELSATKVNEEGHGGRGLVGEHQGNFVASHELSEEDAPFVVEPWMFLPGVPESCGLCKQFSLL